MIKLDVIIPVKDAGGIRPGLMDTICRSSWAGSIVIETSSPLSWARVRAARKCSTEWVMCIDGDVGIPGDLLDRYLPHMREGVTAVSSQAYDQDRRWLDHRRALLMVFPDHHLKKGNFDNRAFVIRRSFLAAHEPRAAFYCEDVELFNRVSERGVWVHLPYCGVRHFPVYKNFACFGYEMWRLRLWTIPGRLFPWRMLAVQLFIVLVVAVSSLSLRSALWRLNADLQWFAGYLMALADGY